MNNKIISTGEKFKIIRQTLHLSQSEFATKLGIGQSYYSAIETGRKQPSVSVMDKLFSLDISSKWYYNGAGEVIVNDIANGNMSALSDLVESNKEQLTQYYRGSELKPYNYEYLQIKYYEQFTTNRIDELIDLSCSELESLHNTYVKLTQIIHYLESPVFLLEKFRIEQPFTSEIKDLLEEYDEDMDRIGLQDEKLRRILYLMKLNTRKENCIYCIEKIADYMFMYKDMIKDAVIDNSKSAAL